MGSGTSTPDPSYIYKSTCRDRLGIPCTKTYIAYQSDGKDLQRHIFITPYRQFSDDDRKDFPEYVAAMVVKHPRKPNKLTDFEAECLDEHNLTRGRHGIQPLKFDKKISKYASEWAKELAKINRLRKRPNSKYGENLYATCGKDINGRDPVKAWYTKIYDYDFHNPGYKENAGHFTQLIWRESKKVGIGVARSGRSTFVVCNYDPPGNFRDDFADNVSPPL